MNFCEIVATSPDAGDKENLSKRVDTQEEKADTVDDRLDPYVRYRFREGRTEMLANVIRQERGVERIVRARSWDLVNERCGGDVLDWEEALDNWRKKQRPEQKEYTS